MLFDRSLSAKFDAIYRSQAIAEFNLDGAVLSANQKFLDALGYTLSDIKGRKHALLVDPIEASSPVYEAFWQALKQGRLQQGEYKRVAKDGREVWIQATYTPVLDGRGRPVRVIALAADITVRKLRSMAVEAKIVAMLRSQAMIEFTIDGTIVDANDNFLSAVGYRLDEIRGQHHRIFVEQNEQASPAYREFWAALAKGEFRSGEYKRLGKDGREVWLQATYNPLFDPYRRPVGVVKFAMDVTGQKLQTLDLTGQIDAIDRSQGVIQFDPNGTILEANKNFLSVVGYRLDEIKGRHHRMFVEPNHASSAEYRQFWEELRAGQHHTAIYKRLSKDGREIWLQATYNPVLDASGRPAKVVKHCTDITASVTARLVAAAATDRVAQSENRRGKRTRLKG
jgi:methyl-accepting chemotaxis protein